MNFLILIFCIGVSMKNETQLKTPVVLIIFNRPNTTKEVFDVVRQARPSKLLVIADGPRAHKPTDAQKCAAVRAIIDQVDWDCEVLTNYADTNLGCGRRVSSGLDWVFETVEEAIILEDDCVPHPTFFRFCEEVLERYRDDERVMMITGTNVLPKLDIHESYLFSRYFNIWGWATWRRAWKKYDFSMTDWERLRAQKQVWYFYPQPYMVKHVTEMFDLIYAKRIDSWDIQWFYCCLFNNGLCVVPRVNLVSNIGLVGTHTTYGMDDPFLPTFALDVENIIHPQEVFANAVYDDALFEGRIKRSLLGRVRRRIASLWRQIQSGR